MAFAKIKPVPEENARNAVIYARYSSEKQTENSIDAQLRAARTYCEAKGLSVIGEYIDRAVSGTTDHRPDFQRMIADAKKQQFAFVVVYRFDRFARNRFDSAIYKKELENCGVRVLSAEESVGTGDEGIILESLYEAMAESYSRRLSKVVARGMRETALKGLSTGGHIAFGYRVEDHRLVIDEGEASAVRFVFEAYVGGMSKTEIAEELTKRGFRTKRGNPFTIVSVTRILESRQYIGENDYLDVKRECPAIVSQELFRKARRVLEASKRTYGKKKHEFNYHLSGKLFCGNCGALMIGDSGTSANGETYPYYTCGKRKRSKECRKKSEKKTEIERYLCQQTITHVLTEENIGKIAKRVTNLLAKERRSGKIPQLEKQLAALDKELDQTTGALIKTSSPAALRRINARIEQLEDRQISLSNELAELRLREGQDVTEAQIVSYLEAFRHGDLSDEDFRRRLIGALINCVYVFDDKVVIYYNLRDSKNIAHVEMLDDLDHLIEDEKSSFNSTLASPTKKDTPSGVFFRCRLGRKISEQLHLS